MAAPNPPATDLPRILCLHGGGTSARIFQVQLIRISRILRHSFKFEFANAPYPSASGPDVEPFFTGMGPFYRWRSPHGAGQAVQDVLEKVLSSPGGPFVGVMGFSQGSMLAMGMLWEQEHDGKTREERGWEFKFGVLCMGGFPILKLGKVEEGLPERPHGEWDEGYRACVSTPTVHVHGTRDFVLPSSRLLERCSVQGTARVLEFDVEHRMPIEKEDNDLLKEAILDAYFGKDRRGEGLGA